MISNNRQLNLALIGEARAIRDLDFDEVARCSTPEQAVRLCLRKVEVSEEEWADELGVQQGTFNSIINADKKKTKRVRNFPLRWINTIQRKAGNRAIVQYLDLESKGMLYCQRKPEMTKDEKAEAFDRLMAANQ